MSNEAERLPTFVDFLARERFRPLHLVIDTNMQLMSLFGDPSYYGYPTWRAGDDLSESFETLHGLDIGKSIELPFIETPNGHAVNIRVEPSGDVREVVVYDVTYERDRRQELQQRSNELSILTAKQVELMGELRSVNSELEIKRIEAEEASRLKSRFIANMSHEFRTPLSSIVGYTELYGGERATGASRTAIDAVERAAKHLMGLVENLLEQAQLEIGETRLNPQPTEIIKLARDMQSFFAPTLAAKGLKFDVTHDADVPLVVLLDPIRVRQILINLIGNACKYTHHGEIALGVSWTNGQLTLRVADTGPGMGSATLEKIFVPFHRAEGTNQSGAGLGLSITKQLIDLMAGTIAVESEPSVGTAITVTIPAAAASLPESRATTEAELSTRSVLVVEDDRDVYGITAVHLRNAGYTVAHAERPSMARDVCREVRPSIVLLDLKMPEMDGCSLTQVLREDGYSNPIVMLTASSLNSDRERALASGCNEFLVKPVLPSELVRVLNTQIDDNPLAVIDALKREFNASLEMKAIQLSKYHDRLHDIQAREELIFELHKMAGSSAIFDVSEVSSAAHKLERLLRGNRQANVSELDEEMANLESLQQTMHRLADLC